ncbi:MAG: PTS transporter subunit EIIC [Mycoplasmataceae bacterium]|nr:PTS transporter subunit EIIC [Mycoplasmataceae bacterium]
MNKQRAFGEVPILLKKEKKGNGKVKEAIAKLSRGLMLPIAMLPIAGLALGVGTTIASQTTSDAGHIIGHMLQMPGNVIFAILPLLFAIAIAITFTNDSGTAGLSAVVGYSVFCIFQTALVIDRPDGYHDFLWYHFDSVKFDSIFTDIIGIRALSTSVFGGIIVGALVAFLYNRFKNIQLPKVLGFFSGVRFIPIITFGAACVLGMLFAMIWPLIGTGLYYLGYGFSYGNRYGGGTAFIYGVVNRVLMPFGLHHVLNTTLWFSSVGGTFDLAEHFYSTVNNGTTPIVINDVNLYDTGYTYAQLAGNSDALKITGDINIQIFLTSIVGKNQYLGQVITIQDVINSYDAVHQMSDHAILAPGQYTNFAYVFGMFGLSGAALGMLFACPKGDSRKLCGSIVIPGAVVSSLTGASESIEFTFIFLAPMLFWVFHTIMAGLAAMITTILMFYAPVVGPHVTFSFSQGIIDFVIYGVLTDARGGGAHCWVLLVLSVIYFPIYWVVFIWAIKKWNLPTPGRNGATKLFNKADWVKKQSGVGNTSESKATSIRDKSMSVIKAYGGPDNILNIDACLTKLRIQVKDKKLVNGDRLKELGALGIIHPSPQSVYAVFGTEADIIKNNMKDIITKGEYKSDAPSQTLKH